MPEVGSVCGGDTALGEGSGPSPATLFCVISGIPSHLCLTFLSYQVRKILPHIPQRDRLRVKIDNG